jgi:hypothetical protein
MIRPELVWIAASLVLAARAFASGPEIEPREFFEQRIRPLLADHCYECHSKYAGKLKGGLSLDTQQGLLKGGDTGPAIVPGDPEKSLLIKAVRSTDKGLQMPPPEGGGKRLSDIQIGHLVAWVKKGAFDPRTGKLEERDTRFGAKSHWAFQSLKIPPIPEVKNPNWPKSPMDGFILAKLEEKNLKPASPVGKRALIRRATFDLTGLPPASEEIDAFLADESPGAFAKVVDRLLGSPHYGEHWGRHWLDVVRYADTAGETADYPAPLAWRYRNYVIDSFNVDKPYDEFIREQIAGDILARIGPREKYAERMIATGYLAVSRRFGFDSENYHYLTIEDTIDTLGKSILGLSISCARCHDHKYDPLTTSDYYGLYGIFESTRYAFPGSEQKQKVRALTPIIPPKESSPKWQQFHERVDALAQKLERLKLPAPSGILRSLDEMDGDFELQAISSGGSRGVLVPPWIYEGQPTITKSAQSPFKNLYRRGQVGVSLPPSNAFQRVAQKLWPVRTAQNCDILYLNADFRASSDATQNNRGSWRFYLGHGLERSTAVEAFVAADSFAVRNGDRVETIRPLQAGQWHNLQLAVNLKTRTFSGAVGTKGERITFSDQTLSPVWDGTIDFFSVEARGPLDGSRPVLETDNIAVQEIAIPSPDASSEMPASNELDLDELHAGAENANQELVSLLSRGPCDLTYGVVEGTPRNARIQLRGDPEKLGREVERGFPEVLGGDKLPPESSGSGRSELAGWLTRPDNPLTARVMVNRIWQYHFGRGLVATPNDFGTRGAKPSHPELLDYLAQRFIAGGWSIKKMHREIMLSQSYQMASLDDPQAAENDPGNEFHWRFNRRRLEAEAVRDSILAISGELDCTPGQEHPFPPPTSWGYTQHAPFGAVYDHNRRSVYLMTQRIKRHPFFALFDGADPNASTPERRLTTVPTQALFFLNDAFVHSKADKFAARIVAARARDPERVELAYVQTLGRPATDEERAEALKFLSDYTVELRTAGTPDRSVVEAAWAGYARVLFSSNEFIHLD